MQLRNRQDFWSGVMFIILGWDSPGRPAATKWVLPHRMGPGYFPFWLGIVLALLGAVVLLGALSKKAEETHVDKFDWRIVFLVVGSVVVYGLVLKLLGVYISVFILVLISSLASHEFSLKVAVANGIFLVVFTYLAFIKGLGLIFPLWPSFLGMN